LASIDPSADAIDRLTSIDNAGTLGTPAVKFNYGYDAAGNLLRVTDTIDGLLKGTNAYTYVSLLPYSINISNSSSDGSSANSEKLKSLLEQ
jgi:hypothetical protein